MDNSESIKPKKRKAPHDAHKNSAISFIKKYSLYNSLGGAFAVNQNQIY